MSHHDVAQDEHRIMESEQPSIIQEDDGQESSSAVSMSMNHVSNSTSNNRIVLLNGSNEEASNVYVAMDTATHQNVEMISMGRRRRRKRRPHADDDDEYDDDGVVDEERPSNEKLLSVAFFSFMGFTVCQTVAAFIAGSEAMMGDSAAMFVDALTYLFNLCAERRKANYDDISASVLQSIQATTSDPVRLRRLLKRHKRKRTLQLELVPPLISVTTLLGVTAFVSHKAIKVLILDAHRSRSQQAKPNVGLMLFFSCLNLLLDALNVFCFAKAKRLLGYETMNDHQTYANQEDNVSPRLKAMSRPRNYEYLSDDDLELDENVVLEDEIEGLSIREQMDLIKEADGIENGEMTTNNGLTDESDGLNVLENGHYQHSELDLTVEQQSSVVNGRASHVPDHGTATTSGIAVNISLDNSDHSNRSQDEQPNLNMCSAYTHVFADTLRSIAVVIAACVAELVDDVTPEIADATAAVIVSVLILLSLIPLFQGLIHTFSELKAIQAEEESELMFPKEAVAELT